MSKENTTTNNTQVATIMPDIFGDIDFSALNSVISKLGTSSVTLKDSEKEFAVNAINTWEQTVIEKLREKENDAITWLNFLDMNSSYCYTSIEEAEVLDLADATGTRHLYEEYLAKVEEIKVLNANRPEAPINNVNDTLIEQITAKRDYEFNCQVYNISLNKLNREASNLFKKFKKELNEKEEIKELIVRLKKYKRNASKFRRECTEKSQLAKINVSIESESVKDSLRDLLNFSVTI